MKPMPNPKQIDQNVMLRLANDRIKLETAINLLEHERINILGNGDPKVSDQDLLRLKQLGCEREILRKEKNGITARLNKMRSAYFKVLSKKYGCKITIK